MPTTMRGSCNAIPIPGTSAPSKSRDNVVIAQVSGFALDPTLVSLFIGHALTAPALYSDLTNPLKVDDASNFATYAYQGTNTGLNLNISDPEDLSGSAFAIGDRLWLCLFDLHTPVAGTAVVASVNLGLLVA